MDQEDTRTIDTGIDLDRYRDLDLDLDFDSDLDSRSRSTSSSPPPFSRRPGPLLGVRPFNNKKLVSKKGSFPIAWLKNWAQVRKCLWHPIPSNLRQVSGASMESFSAKPSALKPWASTMTVDSDLRICRSVYVLSRSKPVEKFMQTALVTRKHGENAFSTISSQSGITTT